MCMKEKIKKAIHFISNPRLLFCWGIAWMITNGWSYIMVGMGTWLDIPWMQVVGSSYLAVLWVPFSPEKLLTTAIAMMLLRLIFPNDQKTLAVLREMYAKAKAAFFRWVNRLRSKREDKQSGE